MLKLNAKLPFALRANAKLACQRRRSRSSRTKCLANWRVAKSYDVVQVALQLRVGLKAMFMLTTRRPLWVRNAGVVSARLRVVENDMLSENARPPGPAFRRGPARSVRTPLW